MDPSQILPTFIVGAGPAGLTLANLLQQQGRAFRLIALSNAIYSHNGFSCLVLTGIEGVEENLKNFSQSCERWGLSFKVMQVAPEQAPLLSVTSVCLIRPDNFAKVMSFEALDEYWQTAV